MALPCVATARTRTSFSSCTVSDSRRRMSRCLELSRRVLGEYPLTTDLGDIHWHTDVPLIDLAPLSQRNAYVDQATGAVHSRAPLSVTFFDVPNFLEGTFPPAGQVADRQKSEIREIRARAFLVCNCEVKREVW